MSVAATGGIESTVGGYKIHKWLSTTNTVALLHFNGNDDGTTFTEETGKTVTTNGGAHIHTGEKKFGSASGAFDGTGDYLTLANSSDFNMGVDGDWTVDFWCYPTDLRSPAQGDANTILQFFCGKDNAAQGLMIYYTYPNGQINVSNGYQTGINTGTYYITLNDWSHIAVTRVSTTINIYVNGVLKGTGAASGYGDSNTTNLQIGRFYDGTWSVDYKGYLDELRVTKGLALWTADFSASLPSGEYSLDRVFDVTSAGDVEVLVVAGGGAGGQAQYHGAGGGAGGVVYDADYAITTGRKFVAVGLGGSTHHKDGENSVFDTITATGGGAGGDDDNRNGRQGGSGGGATKDGTIGDADYLSPRQGYDGGSGSSSGSNYGQGGGGGASAVGGNGSGSAGGAGGDGTNAYSDFLIAAEAGVDISGVHWIAGGGGGSTYNGGTPGAGGRGGGGAGSTGDATAGVANTGGGGGGSERNGTTLGKAGGSGIVIVRYAIPPTDLSIFASECNVQNTLNIYASEVVGSTSNLV